MSLEHCLKGGGLAGGTVGAIGGAIIGGILAGPLWPLGVIAGGVLGANAGAVIGIIWCLLRHRKDDQVSFAKPRFTSTRLSANPDPARKNAPCWLAIHYTVDGNTDRALCEISWTITAEAAVPSDSPSYPVGNNATAFGRAVSFQTVWPQEHDGRRVTGELTLVATLGTERYVFTETVSEIRVPVLP